MSKIRVAVIGAGHLGRIHTKLLTTQKNVDLVAVADPSPSAQQQILDQYDTQTVSDYRKILDKIDAAVIATPTCTHFDVAEELLNHGIHTLIEKPLTESVTDGQRLADLSERNRCVIQVGHVERFNPAFETALKAVGEPKMVIASRMSGYTFRSTDIGVVHDLMIHDIDLVNSFFPGELIETRAVGLSMMGHHEDLAQARLHFSCGGVANLTASRCSFVNDRSMQIFGVNGFASIDLTHGKVTFVSVPDWMKNRKYDLLDTTPEQQAFIRENFFEKVLSKKELEIPKANAILAEQQDWISAIQNGETPRVPCIEGLQAVSIAQSVLDSLASHRWHQTEPQTTGPFGLFNEMSKLETLPANLIKRAA